MYGGMGQSIKQWGKGWPTLKTTSRLNHDMVLFYRTRLSPRLILGGRWAIGSVIVYFT